MQTSSLALATFLAMIPAHLARADDLSPPPWRGTPDSTFQHWGFNSPGGGPPDSGLNNPFGTPLFTPNPNAQWDPVDASGQRTGVYLINFNWDLSFEIPNHGGPGMQKELWLQFTYSTSDGIGPASSVLDPFGSAFTLQSITATSLGGGLYHELHIYTFHDCPQSELVSLRPGSFASPSWVDQVVIDTRCIVPTPGPLAALGVGALMLSRRRR
ncbi:MAG: hypothetical protein IPJ41_06835 [Phycisphaerales bacterium]|nr:hypothetical protein [Phycisphaerales bacterium]